MYYITDYQLCSILILLIVAINFFSKPRFPIRQNTLFAVMICITIVSCLTDLLSVYTVSSSAAYPIALSECLNTINYICLLLLPVVFFLYLCVLTNGILDINRKALKLFMLPTACAFIFLLLNPFHHLFFDHMFNSTEFTKGSLFVILPINMMYYFMLTMIMLRKRISKLPKDHLYALIFLIVICTSFVAIEIFTNRYLLSGLAVSISIVILYLTLQHPSDMTDDATSTFNRNTFIKYINDFKSQDKSFCIIYTALDNTKFINSTFGLATGNMFIRDYTKHIKNNCIKCQVFRISGDKFALAVKDKESCLYNLGVIKNYFKSSHVINNININLSACICYILDTQDLDKDYELITIIEHMMSKAKSQGKGVILNINKQLMEKHQREMDIEVALCNAIKNESLKVYLQPIYSVKDGKFKCCEALARIIDPDIGFIPPDEFIKLAERNGLIVKIGILVLKKVCKFLQAHPEIFKTGLNSIEINLSAIEIVQDRLADDILNVINEYSINPRLINFEITETTATTAQEYVKENMNILCSKNITFSLDDFGVGYSNLDSIIRLPFSTVKLDRSMLIGNFENHKSSIVFKKMISLIKELGLSVVVEGAETEEQIKALIDLEVDYIQGYYYSKPLPMDEFYKFMVQKNAIES